MTDFVYSDAFLTPPVLSRAASVINNHRKSSMKGIWLDDAVYKVGMCDVEAPSFQPFRRVRLPTKSRRSCDVCLWTVKTPLK